MEHSVAVAVVGGVEEAVEQSGLTPSKLVEVRARTNLRACESSHAQTFLVSRINQPRDEGSHVAKPSTS